MTLWFRQLYALFVARNMEFLRDRATLGWNLIFPIFIIAGFAFAFNSEPEQFKVGVSLETPNSAEEFAFMATRYVRFVPQAQEAAAIRKVERHELDMYIDWRSKRYWVNDSSPNGYVLERLLTEAQKQAKHTFSAESVSGGKVRYVDWAIPGILAMNMMFASLWGIGYVIVRYRKNGVLKRLLATPVSALQFLLAQLLSRLWLILGSVVIVYMGMNSFIHFKMLGSYFDLLVIYAVGALCLMSIGLLMASRTASDELANGLLNMISWPMMLLGEIWFSLEGAHPWLKAFSQLLPVTQINQAARAVMLEGQTLAEVSHHIIPMLVFALVTLFLGAKLFRWE